MFSNTQPLNNDMQSAKTGEKIGSRWDQNDIR